MISAGELVLEIYHTSETEDEFEERAKAIFPEVA